MELIAKNIKVEYTYITQTLKGYEVAGTPFGVYQHTANEWFLTDLATGKVRARKPTKNDILEFIEAYQKAI